MTIFEASYIRDKYQRGWPAYRIAARLNDMRDMNLPILPLCDVVEHMDLIDTIERADHGRGTDSQGSSRGADPRPRPAGERQPGLDAQARADTGGQDAADIVKVTGSG